MFGARKRVAELEQENASLKDEANSLRQQIEAERNQQDRFRERQAGEFLAENKRLREQLEMEQNRKLAAMAAGQPQPPFADMPLQVPEEVKMRLGELVESSPILGAFVTVIKSQQEVETSAAVCPGLPDPERQYNAGRAAAVMDMLHMVNQCREEGRAMLEEKGLRRE